MPPTKSSKGAVFVWVAVLRFYNQPPFTLLVSGEDLPEAMRAIADRHGTRVEVLGMRRSVRIG